MALNVTVVAGSGALTRVLTEMESGPVKYIFVLKIRFYIKGSRYFVYRGPNDAKKVGESKRYLIVQECATLEEAVDLTADLNAVSDVLK